MLKLSKKHFFISLAAIIFGFLALAFQPPGQPAADQPSQRTTGFLDSRAFTSPALQPANNPLASLIVDEVEAQETGVFCDEPIPIGEVLEETVEIMDAVFQVYQANYVNLALDNMQGIVGSLSANENVCDFAKCLPYVINRGPTLGLELDALFASKKFTAQLPPWCEAKECLGQPCPDISPYLKDNEKIMGLRTLSKAFETAASIVHDIFDKKTELVTEDLNHPNESPDVKLTKAELVERKIELSEVWLSPALDRRSCSLSPSDRRKVEQGELTDRFPSKCLDALAQGQYWPKPWSKWCGQECEAGLTDDCLACLQNNCDDDPATGLNKRQLSWYADFNCQVFSDCFEECVNPSGQNPELNSDIACYQCLCQRFEQSAHQNESCLDWICGGSAINFVCCSETTIQAPSPTPSQAGFLLAADFDSCYRQSEITNWARQKSHASVPLAALLNCMAKDQNYPLLVKTDSGQQCNWQISSISDSHESGDKITFCAFDNYPTTSSGAPKQCSAAVCAGQSLYQCNCCFHQKGSAHYGGSSGQCIGASYAVDIVSIIDRSQFNSALAACSSQLGFTGKVSALNEGGHLHLSVCQVDGCACN